MQKKVIIPVMLLFLIAAAGTVNALSCITIAGNYDINAEQNKPIYFGFRVYNTVADENKTCDAAEYEIKLEMKNKGQNISDFFQQEISETKFHLNNGESKRVLVTLTPKINSGYYEVLATATRMPIDTEGSGTKMFYAASGIIKISFTGTASTDFQQKPIEFTHRECWDGKMYLKEEPCPEKPATAGLTSNTTIPTDPKNNMPLIVGIVVIIALALSATAIIVMKKEHTYEQIQQDDIL